MRACDEESTLPLQTTAKTAILMTDAMRLQHSEELAPRVVFLGKRQHTGGVNNSWRLAVGDGGRVFSRPVHRTITLIGEWHSSRCEECHDLLAVAWLQAVVENTRPPSTSSLQDEALRCCP